MGVTLSKSMAENESQSSPERERSVSPYKNDGCDMTPVICTARMPRKILDALFTKETISPESDDPYDSYVVLKTTSARKISEIRTHDASADDVVGAKDEFFTGPFVDWDIKRIYNFVKTHIRQDDSVKRGNGWTHFTFVILDEETIENETVLLCCDSPDLGERGNSIHLKAVRFPITELATYLQTTETLVGTLSEHAGGFKNVISQQPPAGWDPVPGKEDEGLFTVASAEYGRRKRRGALLMAERDGMLSKAKLDFAQSITVEGCSTWDE